MLTIFCIARGFFYVICFPQGQLWRGSSLTHSILITVLYLVWPNGYRKPQKRTWNLHLIFVKQLNSSLLQKTVAAKNPENIYFKFYANFMESNLCQHLELISSFKICQLIIDVYAIAISIAEFMLCIKSFTSKIGRRCRKLDQKMIFPQFVKPSYI